MDKTPRLKLTRPQVLLIIDIGLDRKLCFNFRRPEAISLLDCEEILRALPYNGGRDGNEKRVTNALRSRVIRVRRQLEDARRYTDPDRSRSDDGL